MTFINKTGTKIGLINPRTIKMFIITITMNKVTLIRTTVIISRAYIA